MSSDKVYPSFEMLEFLAARDRRLNRTRSTYSTLPQDTSTKTSSNAEVNNEVSKPFYPPDPHTYTLAELRMERWQDGPATLKRRRSVYEAEDENNGKTPPLECETSKKRVHWADQPNPPLLEWLLGLVSSATPSVEGGSSGTDSIANKQNDTKPLSHHAAQDVDRHATSSVTQKNPYFALIVYLSKRFPHAVPQYRVRIPLPIRPRDDKDPVTMFSAWFEEPKVLSEDWPGLSLPEIISLNGSLSRVRDGCGWQGMSDTERRREYWEITNRAIEESQRVWEKRNE